MFKKIFLFIIVFSFGFFMSWLLFAYNHKPEIIEKEIIKYKYEIKELKTREEQRFIVRIPFTNIGLTKDFTLGVIVTEIINFL